MEKVILRKKARFIVAAVTVVMMLFTVAGINGISEANADTTVHKYTKNGFEATVTGDYIAGQELVIVAVGENQHSNPGEGIEKFEPDFVMLEGPYKDYKDEILSDNEEARIKLGAPGKYSFSFDFSVINSVWYTEDDGDMSYRWWEWSDDTAYFDSLSCPISVKGKVIFDPAGGKVTNKTRYCDAGQNVGTLPKATWSNHKFKGWYTKKTKGTKISATTKVVFGNNISKKYYAHWAQKVKVVFNANKGKVSKKYKKVWSGEKYGKLPKANRSGYIFKGWYTKKSGGKKVTYKTKAPNKAKVTLYAHWEKR